MWLRLLITVVFVFEGDLIGFIYMIMKQTSLRVNDASVFSYLVPSGLCGAQAPFECVWLLSSAHLPLLTGICDESFLNNREKRLHFHNPVSYTPAEMKNVFVFVRRKRNVHIHVLC